MTDKIYVVYGTTGEYSDRDEWPVKAFLAEVAAENFANELDNKATELGLHDGKLDYRATNVQLPMLRELDPNASCDYTGVQYNFYEVDLDNR